MRIVNVTAGEVEDFTLLVTDELDRDLSAATFTVALGDASTTPPAAGAFVAPAAVDTSTSGRARITYRVGAAEPLTLRAWLWVRVQLQGQTRFLRAADESLSVR